MELKEFLSQPVKLDTAINEAIEELEMLKQLSARSKSFISSSSSPAAISSVEATVEKICRQEEAINEAIDRYVDTKAEVEEFIDRLPDIEHRTVMRYHYILGYTWEKIADICFISIRNVHYIHAKSLEILSGISEGITA